MITVTFSCHMVRANVCCLQTPPTAIPCWWWYTLLASSLLDHLSQQNLSNPRTPPPFNQTFQDFSPFELHSWKKKHNKSHKHHVMIQCRNSDPTFNEPETQLMAWIHKKRKKKKEKKGFNGKCNCWIQLIWPIFGNFAIQCDREIGYIHWSRQDWRYKACLDVQFLLLFFSFL